MRRPRPRRGEPWRTCRPHRACPSSRSIPTSSTDLDQAFAIEPVGRRPDPPLRDRRRRLVRRATATRSTSKPGRAARQSICPTARSAFIRPSSAKARRACCPTGPAGDAVSRSASRRTARSRLDGAERAIIRSRAKLGYATVRPEELAGRVRRACRGGSQPPSRRAGRRASIRRSRRSSSRPDGGFELEFRPMSAMEQANAALSLAANLAIAEALYAPRHRPVPGHARTRQAGDPAACGIAPRRSASTGRNGDEPRGARARSRPQ